AHFRLWRRPSLQSAMRCQLCCIPVRDVVRYGADILLRHEVLLMDVTLLLPGSAILQLESTMFDTTNRRLTFTLISLQDTLQCPLCRACATRIHSRYTRTIADLPWADVQVQLQLRVRKGFCSTSDCPRASFTERLPALVAPYARRTTRLATAQ